MNSAGNFPFELSGNKIDPQLYKRLTEVFDRLHQLEQAQARVPTVTRQAVVSQLQLIGLLGPLGQNLVGISTSPDPQLQNLPTGNGTLTNFTASPASIFDVANPTTTPALSLDNQAANNVLAGPATGAAATPAFRALVNADLPSQAWQAWTPTWTNLTVGNGTVVAAYAQIGKTTFGRLSIVFGSTTSISGDVQFSLPVTMATPGGTVRITPIGHVQCWDNGASTYQGVVLPLSTTTGTIRPYSVTGTVIEEIAASATIPFMWGTGDEFACEFFYEAA